MEAQEIKLPVYYDEDSGSIFDQDGKRIVDIRGWGWIQQGRSLEDATKFQDEMAKKIAEGINYKFAPEHEFKEPVKMCTRNPDYACENDCTHWCRLK